MDEEKQSQLLVYLSLGLIVIVILFGGYLVWAGRQESEDSAEPTATPTQVPTATLVPTATPMISPTATPRRSPTPADEGGSTGTPSPKATAIQAAEFTISGSEFFFNPNTITAKAGQEVTIVFQNDGTVPHNWALPSAGLTTATIAAGQTDTITFIAPQQTGEFRIECTVPGHAERGMVGTLLVQ